MRKNKMRALFLALAILLGSAVPALAVGAEQGTASVQENGGTENYAETIYIETAEELVELAKNCQLDTWSVGKRVVLKADISLGQVDFQQIPSFAGLFDGNGHTISDFYLTGTLTPAGLFGKLQPTGIVKDLTLSGTVMPNGDGKFVGGIVGENYGTILGCTFTGSVTGASSIGGIAGINALTGKIMDCEASGLLVGTDMTGGVTGCNLGCVSHSVNKAYVNTISVDSSLALEDINLDFLTDISKLTSLDVSSAATDSGGIAGYSSGIVKDCTNKAPVGYPHIGYNVGGIVGRSCGYICACTNAAEVYGRKDVGGIAGQMEPYIAKNLTESELAKLEHQLEELDALVDTAIAHTEGASNVLTDRLKGISSSIGSAASAAKDIRATGTISSSVTGSADSSADGSITVTPIEGNVEGGIHAEDGSVSIGGIHVGDGSISGGGIHVGEGDLSGGVSGSLSGSIEGEGNTSIGAGLDVQTQISISTNMAGLSSALYGMAGQMSMLSGELSGASEELLEDVKQIKAKVNEITENGFDLLMGNGEEDIIVDGSNQIDIDLITLGKVYESTNAGTVHGDINVGGIAGGVGMEYALDPEDDLHINIDSTTKRKYEVRAVIQRCKNTGEVLAKRNYAGGIAGKMDLGLIAQCESYGGVSSESGNYVGGIAGVCGSTIRHCFSKCTLSGNKYVGGIVGSGAEETRSGNSSTVAACYAIVSITECTQYAGAISGAYAGTFLENYFVSEELAGINHMSYAGCAEPLRYEELLAHFEHREEEKETVLEEPVPTSDEAAGENVPEDAAEDATEEADTVSDDAAGESESEEAAGDMPEEEAAAEAPIVVVSAMELPEEFKKFSLQFVAEGEVLYSTLFDYGASFSSEVYPDIPEKEGYYAYWDRTELDNLLFDTTVTAVYEPYLSSLTSGEVRRGEKPVFFVEGDFGESATLTATPMALTPQTFDIPEGVWDAVKKSLTDLKVTTEVVEQWQLQLSEGAAGTHTIRYLPPDGDVKHMDVYILRDGQWQEAETRIVGSYIVFAAEGKEMGITIVHSIQTWWAWLIVAVLLLAVIFLFVRLICKLAKGKGKAAPSALFEEAKEGDSAVPEQNTLPEQTKAKGHGWRTPLLVILALLAGILGTSAFFLLPDLLAEKGAYEILKAYMEKDAIAMELSGEISVGEAHYSLSALVDRTMLHGQPITTISEGGKALYYAGGTVYMENGAAYQISTELPDYSQILELAIELYRHVDIKEASGVYSITATGVDAKSILELLLPTVAPYLPDTESLLVELWTKDGVLSSITFSGNGQLSDKRHSAYSVNTVLAITEREQQKIPPAVEEALATGTPDGTGTLTEDLYRLLMGWQSVNDENPLAADVSFHVDCGVLDLSEQLKLYRWNVSDVPIYSVQKNGYGVYFTEDSLCDSNGTRIPAANAANVDTAKLLDILYAVCMNGTVQCKARDDRYSYELALDEEGMAEVVYAIAPEARKMSVTFSNGSVCLVMENERIQHIDIAIGGSVQVVLSKADMAISVTMDFVENSSATLPDSVKTALTEG